MWQWRRSKRENWTCFTRMLPRHSIQAMGLLHHQQQHQKQYHSDRYPCVHAHIHLQAHTHTHARAHTHYALIHRFHVHHWAIHNTSLDFLDINNAVCLLMLSSTYTHTHTHDALTHCFHAHCWAICNTSFDFLDINNAVCLWINWNRMVKEEIIFPGEVIIKLTLHTFYQAAL